MDKQTDTNTWAMIEKATAQYDQYRQLQQVGDLMGVLKQEREVKPQPPRTDLPLALTTGH